MKMTILTLTTLTTFLARVFIMPCGIWSATNLDEIVGRYGGLNVEEVGAQADKQFIELMLILIKTVNKI